LVAAMKKLLGLFVLILFLVSLGACSTMSRPNVDIRNAANFGSSTPR
jgi:hypothetical protein